MKNLLTLVLSMAIAVAGISQDQSNHDTALDYAKKGLFKKAIETIDLAIADDEPRSAYYLDKAIMFANLQDLHNVQLTLNVGIDVFPDSAELYQFRGSFYSQFNHEEAAIDDYEKALSLTEDVDHRSNLIASIGGLHTQLRRFDDAFDILQKGHEENPENINLLLNLATVCDEVGKPDKTFTYLEKIIEIDPDYTPAYVNLGFKYQLDGQHEKALIYFDKSIEMDPGEPLAYSNRSYSRLVTNDISGAMKDINLSISMYPENSWAYKVRALIHIENGDQRAACEDLNEAKELGFEKRYGSEVNELINKHCGEKT